MANVVPSLEDLWSPGPISFIFKQFSAKIGSPIFYILDLKSIH